MLNSNQFIEKLASAAWEFQQQYIRQHAKHFGKHAANEPPSPEVIAGICAGALPEIAKLVREEMERE